MTYVMSDLHGCYEKYMAMLKKINFQDSDALYILGDMIDRGDGGIAIIQDIMSRDNVTALRGNHEHTAYWVLKNLNLPEDSERLLEILEWARMWLIDGGGSTLAAFQALPEERQRYILSFLNALPIYEELSVNGHKFFLSHTVPKKERMLHRDLCHMEEFIAGEPEYGTVYFDDTFIVTGHTPTGLIDPACDGRVYWANNHIAIDCGAVFGRPLGCICLDTMQEFYC